MSKKKAKQPTKYLRVQQARTSMPTLSQIEMINLMNQKLGTNYAIPETEANAAFLIDGMIDEERRRKRNV